MTIYRTQSSRSPRLNSIFKNQGNLKIKLLNFSSRQISKKSYRLSLRVKLILTAIAMGTIPVSVIGSIFYKIAENSLIEQISQAQLTGTQLIAQKFDLFLEARRREAAILASDRIFTDPNLRQRVTLNQKKAALNTFKEKTGFYDSIIYFDLQGNPLFQTSSGQPIKNNKRDGQYFQQVISNKQITINELEPSSETSGLEYAVPVTDAWSNQVIGIICLRIPQEKIAGLFATPIIEEKEWHSINSQGLFAASTVENLVNQSLIDYYPQLKQLHATRQTATIVTANPLQKERQQLVSYAPLKLKNTNPQLNLGTAIVTDTKVAFASLKSLRWFFWGGTIVTSLVVSAIAAHLTNRLIHPLRQLNNAVSRLSQGQLNTRVSLGRKDELGLLGARINFMAEQLKNQIERQRQTIKNAELISKMAQAHSFRELQLPFNLFLTEIRARIKSDRLIFFQFDDQGQSPSLTMSNQTANKNWLGTVVAESVRQKFPRTLGMEFEDLCFAQNYVDKYQRGRIQAIADIYQADLSKYHLRQLENFRVRASLILPVIVEGQTGDELIGLLIAHQCAHSRVWQQSDIDYLQQIACQLGIVLRGYLFVKQERQQQANLEDDITKLCGSLICIGDGDLTVNATAENSVINDVADLFNTMVKNMIESVTQIKTSAGQIEGDITFNQQNIAQLKEALDQQAHRLVLVFTFVEQIVNTLQEVTKTATATSQVVDSTIERVKSEQINFHKVVADVTQLQTVVDATIHKIKHLETSSQEMGRVISLMGQINLRNSLLVSKIQQKSPLQSDSELVIKKEQELVQQSMTATKELEKISQSMENQIQEMLRDIELNSVKLLKDDHLEAAEPNLQQIITSIQNAKHLILSAIDKTNTQVQTAQKITELKLHINDNSELIAHLNERSLHSLQQTATVTQNLHQAVAHFQLKET